MIIYLLKSSLCLALLLVFYHLVLEREKMHQFNRFYLLGSIVFSFLAPLYIIYIEPITEVMPGNTQISDYTVFTDNKLIVKESINYWKYAFYFSIFISVILLTRFFNNLILMIKKIRKSDKIKFKNSITVLVEDNILPHTFWNYIFINKQEYETKKVEEELFTHELTHVSQKHTIDVLIIELLKVIFWFNPIFYLLKRTIQLNHEFIADNAVVNNHSNVKKYQHLLINTSAWNNEYALASNLNYLVTKKRIVMMTKQTSKAMIWLKQLAVIPLLIVSIFLFAERTEAQEIIEIVEEPQSNSKKNTSKSIDEKLYYEYFFKNGTFTSVKDGKKVTKKFSELSDKEKERFYGLKPTWKRKPRKVTQSLLDKLKDKSKYAIWIDGKVTDNSVLDNYKASDFSNHSGSFVHKNARSKRFPQEYQYHLDTHEYFKTKNQNLKANFEKWVKENHEIVENERKKILKSSKSVSGKQSISNPTIIEVIEEVNPLKSYNNLIKKYEQLRNEKPHYVNSSQKRKAELDDIFSKLGSMYFRLSKENKKNTKRPIHPHNPYLKLMKSNKVFYKLRSEMTEEDKLLIPPPPPKPNASKEEILRVKKAYKEWQERTGNDFAPKPPKKLKEIKEKQQKKKSKSKLKVKEIKPVKIEVKDKTKKEYQNKTQAYISKQYVKELDSYLKQLKIYKKDKSNRKQITATYRNLKYLYSKLNSETIRKNNLPLLPVNISSTTQD